MKPSTNNSLALYNSHTLYKLYGTEVFELNENLLKRATKLAKKVKLKNLPGADWYRSKYDYAPANEPPAIVNCDVATGDVYFAGTLLAESVGNYTKFLTQGRANYCASAQEENAIMEAAVRFHKAGKVNYFNFIVMRTISDFDRPPPGESSYRSFVENDLNWSPE